MLVDGPQGVPIPRLHDQLEVSRGTDGVGGPGLRRLSRVPTVGPAIGGSVRGLEEFSARAAGGGVTFVFFFVFLVFPAAVDTRKAGVRMLRGDVGLKVDIGPMSGEWAVDPNDEDG